MPLSQHACFLETEIAGVRFRWRADDDVIEQFDLQKYCGFRQTSRQTVVCLTRRSVAGGMIVHDDDSVRRRDDRWPEHVTRMRNALIHAAKRNFFGANAMVTRVEQDHAQ